MESMANAVQIAVFNALSANANLTALLAPRIGSPLSPAIYDTVIQPTDSGDNSIFPYVIIGDDDLNDWSTDTASGAEAILTLHSWSRAQNQRESKRILGEIYNSLNRAELTLQDHEFIGIEFEGQQPVVLDPDQETYHGVISFRTLLDEAGFGE